MKPCTNLDVLLQRIAWYFANHRGIAGELNGFTGFGAGHAADNSKDEALQPLGVGSDNATNFRTTLGVRLQRNAWRYTNYHGLAGERFCTRRQRQAALTGTTVNGFGAGHAADNSDDEGLQRIFERRNRSLGMGSGNATKSRTTLDVCLHPTFEWWGESTHLEWQAD